MIVKEVSKKQCYIFVHAELLLWIGAFSRDEMHTLGLETFHEIVSASHTLEP